MLWKHLRAPVALLATLFPLIAFADYHVDILPPVTTVSSDIYNLHWGILWVCVVIFVIVFGAMFWSIFKHRRSMGAKAAQFHENTTIEVIWTIVPFIILIGMAYPATKTVLEMKDASNADITVKITAYQWKWEYDYLQDGVKFLANLATPRDQIDEREGAGKPKNENYLLEVDNPLVVPVGKKVRVLFTANDVNHAWWVPAFGVKQDAIPGFVRDSWFEVDTPGVYRGQCTELCGKDHGFMPIVVEALPEEKYKTWLAEQQNKNKVAAAASGAAAAKTYSLDELKTEGEKVYGRSCVACHQANGQGVPGAFPALARGPITTGPIAGHVDIVMNGSKKNPAMAAWKGQLSDLQLAAVITYERNAFGNTMGDMVQPKDIVAARK